MCLQPKFPKGPCTQVVYTLAPMYLYSDYLDYLRANVCTTWAHGPLGIGDKHLRNHGAQSRDPGSLRRAYREGLRKDISVLAFPKPAKPKQHRRIIDALEEPQQRLFVCRKLSALKCELDHADSRPGSVCTRSPSLWPQFCDGLSSAVIFCDLEPVYRPRTSKVRLPRAFGMKPACPVLNPMSASSLDTTKVPPCDVLEPLSMRSLPATSLEAGIAYRCRKMRASTRTSSMENTMLRTVWLHQAARSQLASVLLILKLVVHA